MQVEILARRGMVGDPGAGLPPRPPPGGLGRRKAAGALAPWVAIAGAILVAVYVDPALGRAAVPVILVGMIYSSFWSFPRGGLRAAVNAVIVIAALALEIVVGGLLVLGTFAVSSWLLIVYLSLVVVVPLAVIRPFISRRNALPPLDAVRPTFPWPPES